MKSQTLFSQDAQHIWNKLNQISDSLEKQKQEMKHIRRDISDLDGKVDDLLEKIETNQS